MMISPEAYYITSLEGKSQQEIMKQIRSLKREIKRMKKSIEEVPVSGPAIYPTPLTRISCYRDYLSRAVRAYEVAGGKYEPTKAERRSLDFNQSLDSMKKLVFSIGGFFEGRETRTFTFLDEKTVLTIEHTMNLKPSNRPVYFPVSRKAFINGLKRIHIGEWKRDYCDPDVMDGTQWELTFYFSDKHRKVEISGSNAYPYNFDDLKYLLGITEDDSEDDWR